MRTGWISSKSNSINSTCGSTTIIVTVTEAICYLLSIPSRHTFYCQWMASRCAICSRHYQIDYRQYTRRKSDKFSAQFSRYRRLRNRFQSMLPGRLPKFVTLTVKITPASASSTKRSESEVIRKSTNVGSVRANVGSQPIVARSSVIDSTIQVS